MTVAVVAYAVSAPGAPLEPTTISRREVGPWDVSVEIAYLGVCHSDIHTVRDEWGGADYPVVPGHEITEHVTPVGDEVTRFSVGNRAGVGGTAVFLVRSATMRAQLKLQINGQEFSRCESS